MYTVSESDQILSNFHRYMKLKNLKKWVLARKFVAIWKNKTFTPKDTPNVTLNECTQDLIPHKTAIFVNTQITIQNWTLKIPAFIDTGCSLTILDESLVPKQYHQPISNYINVEGTQMDGTSYKYTNQLKPAKLSFCHTDQCLLKITGPCLTRIMLRKLNLPNISFIIGLNFLFENFQGFLFTPLGCQFLTNPLIPYASEVRAKRGGTLQKTPCCDSCTLDRTPHTPCCTHIQTLGTQDIILDEFTPPTHWLADLLDIRHLYLTLETGNYQIDSILSRLDKFGYFGIDPQLFWHKNKIECKLQIKDPNQQILNKKIIQLDQKAEY